jgi:hypothetical protein
MNLLGMEFWSLKVVSQLIWILDKMVDTWVKVLVGVDKTMKSHMKQDFEVNCSKAAANLNWRPNWNLEPSMLIVASSWRAEKYR